MIPGPSAHNAAELADLVTSLEDTQVPHCLHLQPLPGHRVLTHSATALAWRQSCRCRRLSNLADFVTPVFFSVRATAPATTAAGTMKPSNTRIW